MTTTTVIDYVLGRLHDIGVTDIFGVPGDFAFPVQDAIVAHPDINWIGSCNELNALGNGSSNSPFPRMWWDQRAVCPGGQVGPEREVEDSYVTDASP